MNDATCFREEKTELASELQEEIDELKTNLSKLRNEVRFKPVTLRARVLWTNGRTVDHCCRRSGFKPPICIYGWEV